MVSNVVTNPRSPEAALRTRSVRSFEEADDKDMPVILRLHGRVIDVKAVVGHWRIEVERLYTNNNLHDECAVDGILSLGGQ